MVEKTKFDEMIGRLPSNIKDSTVLRFQSKKVLAALLDYYLHSQARETKLVIIGNSKLRSLSGIKQNDLTHALNQLEDYDLITRKVGKKGKDGIASEYTIHFKNLLKPLKEKTFEDLFFSELEDAKSSGTSMGTTTTITTSTTTPTTITTATTSTTANTTSTATPNTGQNTKENKTSWLNSCFLDPNDFKEDYSFIEDLNKREAYARWDCEEDEE